ncbi:hypothetical protein J7E50_10260 [Pedobacter sp. ISL-68]|uniref:hypothetical protein n=1 Tax=unclassified Pedobacter TaxID=2628915 RepID=UPI001BEAD761|nr:MULTISPECIES: hypothetical protein [unclassified Pedobacter]MBT2561213.1 hypothetical protein [Pedobacter sp. ISL-64]MBT2590602.1 hypothetical protein [Pedobacter sp. ISL-68]
MMKILATSFALSICIYSFSGQAKGITPMHKIFQQFADSTIIIEYPSQSSDPPSYKIVSKSNDTINTFTYFPLDTTSKNFIKFHKSMPKVLGMVLSMHKTSFNTVPANVNIFFNFYKVNPDTAKKMWLNISKFKPWQLLDDKSYPECSAVIMDASYSIMHLITKKEIKTLIYYAPYYYEKQCPGNKNRQGITGIERLFDKYIPLKVSYD